MQINFTSNGLEITKALRDLTTSKLEKIVRHFDKISEINVKFGVENLNQIVEATILATKAKFHAHSSSDDMYNSIDALIEKLDRQIIKHKEKIKEHHHRGE